MRRAASLLWMFSIACDRPVVAIPDDAAVPNDGASIPAPAPPQPTARPVLTPCPAGWVLVEHEVAYCEPFDAASCPAGELRFPGETQCHALGDPCPSDGWPRDLPSSGVLYVRLGSAGDGTRERPFDMIWNAMQAATPGTIVAVAPGTYEEWVDVPPGVHLRGACSAQTIFTHGDPTMGAVVHALGPDARLSDVTIRGGRARGGVVAAAGATLTIERVAIEGANVAALGAIGTGVVRGHDVVITDTHADVAGLYGYAINAEGGTVELGRLLVERATNVGVFAEQGGQVACTDTAIRHSRAVQPNSGRAANAQDGASIAFARSVFEHNAYVALMAFGPGSSIALVDSVVRDNVVAPEQGYGGATAAEQGGRVTLERVRVERVGGTAIHAILPGSEEVARDVLIRDVAPLASGRGGVGINADFGARMQVERAWIEHAGSSAIALYESDGSLSDVSIRDAVPDARGIGRGLNVESSGAVDLVRADFVGCADGAIFAHGAVTLTARDVSIAGTRETGTMRGVGVSLQRGTSATLERLRIVDGVDGALLAADADTRATVVDLEARATRNNLAQSTGRGVTAQSGASLEVTRARIADHRGLGAAAFEEGSRLVLRDAAIERSAARECCPDVDGIGAGAYGGGELDLERFVIVDSALTAAQLVRGGRLRMRDGEIRGAPFGVNVQVEGYDFARSIERVRFVDVEVNVAGDLLPVGTPSDVGATLGR